MRTTSSKEPLSLQPRAEVIGAAIVNLLMGMWLLAAPYALGYDRSYLVGLLDDLEKRGLIERKRDPADRRRHLVKLTPAGKKTLAKLRALQRSIDDDFFAPLSAEERAKLHTLLHRLATYHDPRFGNGHA